MITEKQLKKIHTLLGKVGLRDDKEAIISHFTTGRTTSSRQMMKDEAAALISHLTKFDGKEESCEKMRSKILSYAHEMGWRLSGSDRIDMPHVNNWCLKNSYLKKKLDDYTHDELPKLVTQFETVYKSFLLRI